MNLFPKFNPTVFDRLRLAGRHGGYFGKEDSLLQSDDSLVETITGKVSFTKACQFESGRGYCIFFSAN